MAFPEPSVFVIDNYDSFTYNLVHYLQALEVETVVKRNDDLDFEEIAGYSHILVSPGPGLPSNAGKAMDVLYRFAKTKRILGVCLGMQAMVEMEGGEIRNLPRVSHGEQCPVKVTSRAGSLFQGIPDEFLVGRYHSWGFLKEDIPPSLQVTAMAGDGFVMAVKHKNLDLEGVQFHPESIMTEFGMEILKNWVNGGSERRLFPSHEQAAIPYVGE